jgi:lipid-A-disaccharide synthase
LSSRAVFLAAGEQSGDLHGAELARELRRRVPDVRLYGLGGSRMAAEGVDLLADLDRLAVLGLAEVVRHMPDLARLRREVRRFLVDRGVDLLVPIDYPGFNLPLAGFARSRKIPVLYYIAPQVWAWHESRARKLARDADLVCVVLPFEAALLKRWGVRTCFVGHPLLDRVGVPPSGMARPDGGTSKDRSGIYGDLPERRLALFPGSRAQEVHRLLPIFLDASNRSAVEFPDLRVQVARARDLSPDIYAELGTAELVEAEDAISSASAAITKSGTITLQLALAGVPMVVGYRVNPLTYRIARRLVRVEHIALVNLVAGREIVPELVQDAVTPVNLAEATRPLLDRGSPTHRAQLAGLADVVDRLGTPGAAARVAEECMRLLGTEA